MSESALVANRARAQAHAPALRAGGRTPLRRAMSLLALAMAVEPGCAGQGPLLDRAAYARIAGRTSDAPAIVTDIDGTIYDVSEGRALRHAAEALTRLARDHGVIYLTARPTIFRIPGLTANRNGSFEFLCEEGFPAGPLYTSSLYHFIFLGQDGGKLRNLHRIREEDGYAPLVAGVGDKLADWLAYRDIVGTVFIIFDGPDDPDREDFRDVPEGGSAPLVGAPAWITIERLVREGTTARLVLVLDEHVAEADRP